MKSTSIQSDTALNLINFSQIHRQPVQEWQLFHQEGEQYLNVAIAALRKKRAVFTNRILYNLLAMAMEKLVMASLMEIGRLPYNHTMHDLADALEHWLPERVEGLGGRLRAVDRFQEICDLHQAAMPEPGDEDILGMVDLAKELHDRLGDSAPGGQYCAPSEQ